MSKIIREALCFLSLNLQFCFRETRHFLVSLITRGRISQEFIGARWISSLLRHLPLSRRRSAALWFLSLSPHYFKSKANRGMTKKEFFESEFRRIGDSRRAIATEILKKFIRKDDTVLDYGCGPGFLARAVSPFVKQVFACDISEGAIECASILNGAPNIRYLAVPTNGELALEEGCIDLAYSFAVIQHVTDQVFDGILKILHRLLKSGGMALLHIVVDNPTLRSEAERRNDSTLRGKLYWRYWLHFFGRSKADVVRRIISAGFSSPEVFLIRKLGNILGDDIEAQHLFVFQKFDGPT